MPTVPLQLRGLLTHPPEGSPLLHTQGLRWKNVRMGTKTWTEVLPCPSPAGEEEMNRGSQVGATRPTWYVGRQVSHSGEHMSLQRPRSEGLAWTQTRGPGHMLPLHWLGLQEPFLQGTSRAANKGTFAHNFLSQAAPLREICRTSVASVSLFSHSFFQIPIQLFLFKTREYTFLGIRNDHQHYLNGNGNASFRTSIKETKTPA